MHEDFRRGPGEAAKIERGPARSCSQETAVKPVRRFSARQVKEIRRSCGLTQVLFAGFLGVSVKTVEAWERGRNAPAGPASRLIAMAEKDPGFPYASGLLSVRREGC